ncbi:fumarylacetoacetate hydrolase [Bradyrhizobium sp. LTSPM299]|uniref:fumarylacetoacetate hydrolase family protein n=1 Tax=Bradyrhizobium sp. LTSPM299 TaxID=1619233 RepID=UPI0005C974E5|nr:fumarylacetoacetate hydrolase family protein [Bradyrhizobium sp. LTSPM299]KJC55913.1 fumarylacetoacetate hydrolase [Bradyrhizobium sp. LTSPM299]
MKIANFNQGRIGIIDGEFIADVSRVVNYDPVSWPPTGMLRFIASLKHIKPRLLNELKSAKRIPLTEAQFNCPIAWPNKVIAYPANYHAHIDEMKAGTGLISKFNASGQGFFLKSNSSLSGPGDPIVLPALPDREIHHECELAIIIGKGGRGIPVERALDHIFGYSCLIDVVVRGKEERVMRKSFDSFCPMGPYITTADEVPRYYDIDLQLTVNGDLRQKANTRDLIVGVPEMISMASSVMTLYPGDIIASGTPAGVGPLRAGDRVEIRIAGVGEMVLDVEQGKEGAHPVWEKASVATA